MLIIRLTKKQEKQPSEIAVTTKQSALTCKPTEQRT
jgi:hypothetical protein